MSIYKHIFDTHAHYDDEKFDEDRDELLKSLSSYGINKVVNVGATMDGVRDSVRLASEYNFVYSAAGIHPNEAGCLEENENLYDELRAAVLKPKTVAVGEIGLDYYWDEPDRTIQKKHFERQLELARQVGKPVNIHSRDAAADTLDMMKALKAGEIGGIIHCFSYGKEMAREYLSMGYYLGIGGVVTFKNSRVIKEVVEYMPLDRLVLETDSPYLAPEPYRGKRNASIYLPYVVEKIAEIKGISPQEVIETTWDNAHRVYKLNKE